MSSTVPKYHSKYGVGRNRPRRTIKMGYYFDANGKQCGAAEVRNGVTIRLRSGPRHNDDMSRWLRRVTIGTGWKYCYGLIGDDGDIQWTNKAKGPPPALRS